MLAVVVTVITVLVVELQQVLQTQAVAVAVLVQIPQRLLAGLVSSWCDIHWCVLAWWLQAAQ